MDIVLHDMTISTRGGQGVEVLVAEDDAPTRRLMAHALGRMGCGVHLAGNGREALDLMCVGWAGPCTGHGCLAPKPVYRGIPCTGGIPCMVVLHRG